MAQKRTSVYYGFGALGITSVKLSGIEETFQNPNLENKPFATQKPLKTVNSFKGKNALYPNYKYAKSNQHKKRKKKQHKGHNLLYSTDDNHAVMHTAQSKILSPRKRKLVRPSSAIPSKSNHDAKYIPHYAKNLNSNTESIQCELMKQHINDLDELKQEISDQMNRNNNDVIISHNQTNDKDTKQTDSINNVSVTIRKRKKPKPTKKIFVPTPTTSVVVCVNKEPLPSSVSPNNHNNQESVTPKSQHDVVSPKRPKHQSFQNIQQSARPVLDVIIKKKGWKSIVPKVHTTTTTKLNKKSTPTNRTPRTRTPKTPRYKISNRDFVRKNGSVCSQKNHTYYSYHKRPITAQPTINKINVGTESTPIENRLSSTFASNTPRIFPLNKLVQNPSYCRAMSIKNITRKNNCNKKKQLKRPWSSKPKTKPKRSKLKRHTKNKKQSKKHIERPKSAPAISYQHPSMKSYMENVQQNLEKNHNHHQEAKPHEIELWNPFDGITIFELQYLILFLKTKQKIYRINDETLDILDKCLKFYVRNDSYETAWNAWNIIQKFLLPDTNKIRIDKTLCRDVLHQYQAQSRDLKHNHIEEELFDGIIQEIGLKIATKIPNRQQFTIDFENFVIQYQQTAQQSKPKQIPKRPQSAVSVSVSKTHDLVHNASNRNRPQSALNSSNIDSKLQTIDESLETEAVNVLNVQQGVTDTQSENKETEIKYSLDGIIDEM